MSASRSAPGLLRAARAPAALAVWSLFAVQVLLATRASASENPPRDPMSVRQAAREILSAKEFRTDRSPFAAFFDWLADRLSFTRGALGGGGPGLVGDLIAFALTAGAIVLIVRLVATRQRRMAKLEHRDDLLTTTDRRLSADDWAAAAASFEGEGRLREAVRARYRELLARLAENGTIVELVGKTSGELLAELSDARGAAAEPFSGATRMFERAWYGGSAVSEQDLRSFERAAADVLEASREPVSA